jgi:tetratricopeptide (TPR) repeat protein
MSDYYDLGKYGRAVSTKSADAQLWFDRGLVWTYGFNHEEAVRCFEKAADADPACAMAQWGIAYAAGPNYNKPWEAFDEADMSHTLNVSYAAAQKAMALKDQASAVEQALIEALQARYPDDKPAEDMEAWNAAYGEAMRSVYNRFPDDLDVASLFAEAIMNITPWQLWDLPSGQPAEGAHTVEATDVLERAMAQMPTGEGDAHPGLLHLYIHLMEMSPHPQKALRAGDLLRDLVPDSGHLVHMPTHIDVLCGHYSDVVAWNQRATIADRRYKAIEGSMNFYTLYRSHNLHFAMYGAMFIGQENAARAAADELQEDLTAELLKIESPPMAEWVEAFVPMKIHVLIRFGRWQEIIDQPLPDDPDLFCSTTALLHYAKGVAHATLGQVEQSAAEVELFEAAVKNVPDTRYLFNNTVQDILAVAREMLLGELEYRKENYDVAFAHLRKSVELDDNLPYDEPWAWMQPARHALGALLLEQGHVAEAEAVYRADLGLDQTLARACQHPDNIWSLHGLHECLLKTGKTEEAAMVKLRLDLANGRADEPVTASCYCRLNRAA